MSGLGASDFAAFFRGVHGFDPFPWQQRLVQELLASGGQWPDRMALPTASGKTACVDIAVFTLACDAARTVAERTAPRRILFVVDRRVIVDQTLDHAEKIADKLKVPRDAAVLRVADALRSLGADRDRPLDVYALRGGMYRESAWVRSPLQPTVVTTTVDQVGSRLLFRGYGVSSAACPIHASLTAIGSLIILDEAHISRPFEETMDRIRHFASQSTRSAVGRPVQFVAMSATPRAGLGPLRVFELDDADRAPDKLGQRLGVAKQAELRVVSGRGSGKNDPFKALIEQAVVDAKAMLAKDRKRIGVIVNRVATARAIAERLRKHAAAEREKNAAFEVELLTGRTRPADRDAVTQRLERVRSKPAVADGADSAGSSKPAVVVATQTIEVGADLDFDALITECASLDALRQRFGRLNRIGRCENSDAVILARDADAKEGADDPIYGTSLARTWAWLESRGGDGNVVDMSTMSIGRLLAGTEPESAEGLSPPQPSAATLLSPHLDLLCQTGPEPAPTPDIAPYLRGSAEASTDLSVVFRADLGEDHTKWAEIIALCPPSSTEALPVRVGEMRRWLMGKDAVDATSSDVEGLKSDDDSPVQPATERVAVIWKGDDRTAIRVSSENVDLLRPTLTLVVPVTSEKQERDARLLGDLPVSAGTDSDSRLDVGDEASCVARDRLVLRLRRKVYPCLPETFDSLDAVELDPDELDEHIVDAIARIKGDVLARHNGRHHKKIADALQKLCESPNRRIQDHPLGGVVVYSRRRLHLFDPTDADEHDRSVSMVGGDLRLDRHTDAVARVARDFADAVPISDSLRRCIVLAARYHDIGKADPRFQALLCGGNRLLVGAAAPLAKSDGAARWRNTVERSPWPKGERHEFYSLRMAETALRDASHADLAALSADEADLVLHLIAAHHGYARPFAPVVLDDEAEPSESFQYEAGGALLRFNPVKLPDTSSGHGYERLDSGVAERFWRLTRHYGWWGLAYLEAIVRLADWKASEQAELASDQHSDERASVGSASGVLP